MYVPSHCMHAFPLGRAPVSLFDTRRRCQESLRQPGNPEPQTTRLSALQQETPSTSRLAHIPPQCPPHALLSSALHAQRLCAKPSSPTSSDPSAPLSQKVLARPHQTSHDGSKHHPRCECLSAYDRSLANPCGRSTSRWSWWMMLSTSLSDRLVEGARGEGKCCRKRSR